MLCCAGVTGLLPALPANCSCGTLRKQTNPSPEIRLKCGKGICDSHWQWKWQQVWAQQMVKHPAAAPSQPREAVEQMQSSSSMWDGAGGAKLMCKLGRCAVLRVQPLQHTCFSQNHGKFVFPGAVLIKPLPPAQLAHSQFPRKVVCALSHRLVILISQKQWSSPVPFAAPK